MSLGKYFDKPTIETLKATKSSLSANFPKPDLGTIRRTWAAETRIIKTKRKGQNWLFGEDQTTGRHKSVLP